MENGHEPATKQDLGEVEGRLRAEMGELEGRLETRLRAEIKSSEEHVIETMRDIQTELLKAFYGFTESNRQRVAQLEGNQGAIITRIGVLEDRMTDLERKVHFPQHPPQ
jgi:hypothetical protein